MLSLVAMISRRNNDTPELAFTFFQCHLCHNKNNNSRTGDEGFVYTETAGELMSGRSHGWGSLFISIFFLVGITDRTRSILLDPPFYCTHMVHLAIALFFLVTALR
jgi:hypothetical protein